jgi:NADH-quinone oxidoreductase subunit D
VSHVHQAGEAFASNAAESRQEIRNYTMNFGRSIRPLTVCCA